MSRFDRYRHYAAQCEELAKEADQVYARSALLELADDFRGMVQQLERRIADLKQTGNLLHLDPPSSPAAS
jgi:hypothetical protein